MLTCTDRGGERVPHLYALVSVFIPDCVVKSDL